MSKSDATGSITSILVSSFMTAATIGSGVAVLGLPDIGLTQKIVTGVAFLLPTAAWGSVAWQECAARWKTPPAAQQPPAPPAAKPVPGITVAKP